jgi:hypothetical protein
MPSELLFFHKGISSAARSALQEPGTLRTCENISLEKEGEQGLRPKFTAINTTAVGSIHSIHRWGDLLIIGDGTHLRFRDITTDGDFTDMYASFTNAVWRFQEYGEFLHGVNGAEEVLIDSSGNCYPADVANPATAATLADKGSGSGPSGHYMGYVSYLITWPNGMTYETGLSSASADVNVVDNTIAWSAIPVSPYAAYYGTAPTIHRKLYRGPGTGGTLTDIYYVTTIEDNTTVAYDDSATNSTLTANGASLVDDYDVLPHSKYIEYHYGRAYVIDAANVHRLGFSEAAAGETADDNEIIMPIAHDDLAPDWDDLRVSGFSTVDPQGLVSWGTNIYIPLKHTWIRKQGNDPDTWSYKKTWAQFGIGAPDTISICPQPSGILGVSAPDGGTPGLCLFNGQTSEMISGPKLDYVFQTDLDHAYIANCRGFCAGRYYHLIYPSHDATSGAPDKWLAVDLRRIPDIRCAYWKDLDAVCGCSYDQGGDGGTIYIGTSTGYAKKSDPDSAEKVNVVAETEDRIGGDVSLANTLKQLKEFKYNLNGTASLQIIIDGTAATWPDTTTSKTITGTGDAVQVMKSLPTNFQGYKYRVKVTATAVTAFTIYSPWEMIFDPK